MHPARLLGSIALIVGGGLLLSPFLFGQNVLTELADMQWGTVQLLCGLLIGAGLIAISIGLWELPNEHQKGTSPSPARKRRFA